MPITVSILDDFAGVFNCNQCGCNALDHYIDPTDDRRILCERCSPKRNSRHPECAARDV